MKKVLTLLALGSLMAVPVHAEISAKQKEVMDKLLVTYAEKAKAEGLEKKGVRGGAVAVAAANKPFTVENGREFYLKRRSWQDTDYTCSGCHTEDPKKEGKHIDTKKPIKPLAPAVNPERFLDVQKVERNFTEHCMDLHERDCFAFEKGNFVAYMMSVK